MKNKIAVVGLGSISKRHLSNIKKLYPESVTMAVSASGRLHEASLPNVDRMYPTIEEVIDAKPDIAIIASPATYHYKHAKPFLENRIPVLIEKPIIADISEAAGLLNCIEKAAVPVEVGYCLRQMPAAQIVKNIMNEKVLGAVYNVFVDVGQYLPDWRGDKPFHETVTVSRKLGGGVLLELSHELDYLQWFFGDLHFQYAQLRNSKELDLEVEEIADLVLTTSSGAVCNIHMNCLQKSPHRSCQIIGERGQIEWNLTKNKVSHSTSEGTKLIYDEPDWDRNQMYVLMLEKFVQSCRDGLLNKSRVNEAVQTVRLIDEIKNRASWGVTQ